MVGQRRIRKDGGLRDSDRGGLGEGRLAPKGKAAAQRGATSRGGRHGRVRVHRRSGSLVGFLDAFPAPPLSLPPLSLPPLSLPPSLFSVHFLILSFRRVGGGVIGGLQERT